MRHSKMLIGLGLLGLATAATAAETNGPRDRFQNLDTDGNGTISFAEFQQAERDQFSVRDTDGNGVLTLDEFLTGPEQARREAMRERMLEMATARFQEMDLDGDEQLTVTEVQEAAFQELDRDGDGVLSQDELRRPRQGRPGPRPRGGRGTAVDGQSNQE